MDSFRRPRRSVRLADLPECESKAFAAYTRSFRSHPGRSQDQTSFWMPNRLSPFNRADDFRSGIFSQLWISTGNRADRARLLRRRDARAKISRLGTAGAGSAGALSRQPLFFFAPKPIAHWRRCPFRRERGPRRFARRRYRSVARGNQEKNVSARRRCDGVGRAWSTDKNRHRTADESVRSLNANHRSWQGGPCSRTLSELCGVAWFWGAHAPRVQCSVPSPNTIGREENLELAARVRAVVRRLSYPAALRAFVSLQFG